MKLTKKLEAEIRKVYEAFWESLLNVNMRKFNSFLSEDFKQIGTTDAEVFFSKKEAAKFLKATEEQVVGNIQLRNRDIKIEPFDRSMLITEQSDAYVKIDNEWNFYAKCRVTSLLQEIDGKWKFIQQHISFPDNRTKQGETIALEQIKTENLQLRDAVKRRTVELENKNRELEIEAALERARTQSMLMQHSNELNDTLQVFHKQIQLLGINSDFSYLWLPDEENDKHVFWATWQEEKNNATILKSKTLTYPLDRNESYTAQCLADWKSGIPVHAYKLPPAEVKNYFTAWQELLSGAEKLKAEFFPDGFDYVEAFMKYGCFGIAVSRVLTEDEKQILRRFTIEFERAYTRFLDLQKAEAQARESQIQLALERVRARTMAMHHSDELTDVVKLLYQEFDKLKINNESTDIEIGLIDEETGIASVWAHFYLSDGTISTFKIPFTLFEEINNEFQQWKATPVEKRNDLFFTTEFSAEQWDRFMRIAGELPELAEIFRPLMEAKIRKWVTHNAYFSHGLLTLQGTEAYSPETQEIQKRFAKVFEQTYTRFLDLQKAEAQAKEAQIETALERVRSRTMGMQKSEELKDVIQVVYEQFIHLSIQVEHTGFIIDYKERDDMHIWLADKHAVPFQVTIPYFDCAHWNSFNEAKEKGTDFFANHLSFEEKNKFYQDLFKLIPGVPEETLEYYFSCPGLAVSTVLLENIGLYIENFSGISYTDEENKTLMRFGKVFQQTYTRFLDLQKAERQAREAQIEVSLERVRSKAMAMHKTEDLTSAVSVVFDELDKLQLGMLRCGIGILHREKRTADVWTTAKSETGTNIQTSGDEPMDIHPLLQGDFDAWLRQEDFSYVLEGKDLENYYHVLTETNFQLPESASFETIKKDHKQYYYVTPFELGTFFAFREAEFTPEAKIVMKRFANVFNLTYKRFLDLQKAEAQTRESQIELGLERVRARAMAMQKSDELSELVDTVFKELTKLDFALTWCIINIIDESSLSNTVWAANPDINKAPESYHMLFEDYPFHHAMMKGWKERQTKYVYTLEGSEKKIYDDYLFSKTEFRRTPEAAQAASRAMEKYVVSFSFSNFGGLQTVGDVPLSDASLDILSRFGKVFDLTYTRFNDLKQAEAQARESQIQLALERVRARTMAMQKSDELREAVLVIYEQLKLLNFETSACNIIIIDKESGSAQYWVSGFSQEIFPVSYAVPYLNHPYHDALLKPWIQGDKYVVYEYTGKMKQDFDEIFFTKTEFRNVPDEAKNVMIGLQSVILSTAFISYGAIQSLGAEPLSNENASILQRFAKVFEQTYTRFLDLQKAEAQTREAKIEAALERVRSRTMAMQRSEELLDVASILFQQVKGLGVPQWNCGFNIWNIGDREFTYYPGSPDGVISPTPCQIPLTEHPVFMRFDESRKRGDDLLIFEKQGEEQEDHYRYMLSLPGVGDLLRSMMDAGFQLPTFQIDHVANFSYGNLIFITFEHFPQMHDVFKRFAKVFDQTYTRFLDLQKAEAQAREAVKQASVDRIRAEIASMRTTNDLERIQPLIWNELTTLGVPFTRCGVFIMDEEHERVDTFLSTPDGRSIASFTSNYPDVAVISEALPYWRRKEIYKAHWDEATFLAQAKTLLEQGNITSTETYLTEHRPKDLYLHFLPFLQGILYVGNETPLNDEELQLVQNLADAFSIAYARYEDFNKLELAKGQIEKTLVDLKQTQAQLVQSEKMASLGELTAGIAHEIQNPLNFVNNFSEVNKELLAEMNEEIEKGNYEEVKNIANDVTDNEEKISHHGKRADAIVKGMLQHSRSSSGIKEPADINALADEYLRLAYHGLRAKDKFFNATMKTAYDETIGKINIVPQDIGRSVLNLITNAFYAVAEKKKQNGEGYEPTVTVTTKRINGRIEIRVADNGNGIPQKVVDKIFQPFFTTKPTGQGTGLGLSLSYDIIKAHGGEINVETKEGEGSDFFIFLPANN